MLIDDKLKGSDYKEFLEIMKFNMKIQGIEEDYFNRNEILYFDESGNDKYLQIKDDGKLNTNNYANVFVLGGVQAKTEITTAELYDYLNKDSKSSEIKSTKFLKGTFVEVLNKDNCSKILNLLYEKDWNIHFHATQVLYYGFVDIVDSLETEKFLLVPEYKAMLYEVLKENPNDTIKLFKEYKYPDIKDNKKNDFLNELNRRLDLQIKKECEKSIINPFKLLLKQCIEKAKQQKELVFIQERKPYIWVDHFYQFYKHLILTFVNKKLIFDNEEQVKIILDEEKMFLNGELINNFEFKDSKSCVMLQISDCIVSILRKYFMFLDRDESEVERDIGEFNDKQMSNFKLLNILLNKTRNYNPLFENFVTSIHLINKYNKYLKKYSYV